MLSYFHVFLPLPFFSSLCRSEHISLKKLVAQKYTDSVCVPARKTVAMFLRAAAPKAASAYPHKQKN